MHADEQICYNKLMHEIPTTQRTTYLRGLLQSYGRLSLPLGSGLSFSLLEIVQPLRLRQSAVDEKKTMSSRGCATVFCKRSSDVQKRAGAYGNLVEIPLRTRSGVKIAVRAIGSEEEKPQSGLAHAVQFLVRNAPEIRSKHLKHQSHSQKACPFSLKNKHVDIFTSLTNKTYVNWTACARPDCGWSLGRGSLLAAILTPLRACPMVAAMEPDLHLGWFAKNRGKSSSHRRNHLAIIHAKS